VSEALELLRSMNSDALTADGFDEALIGVLSRPGRPPVAVYDIRRCLEILSRDMTEDDAEEYFAFNTLDAYVGPLTPVYMDFRWRSTAS